MSYLGWASFGGNEIVNNSRVSAYARGVGVQCQCDALPESLGDDPYAHPAEDPAPWHDDTAPESADFWGVLGLEITGAAQSTLSTTLTNRIGDGAIGSAPRRGSREIEFKVMLLAGTESGLSYGVSWLQAALRGAACATGCAGDDLCLYAACPEPPEHEAPADECAPHRDEPIARLVPTVEPSRA